MYVCVFVVQEGMNKASVLPPVCMYVQVDVCLCLRTYICDEEEEQRRRRRQTKIQ
jgi:hypothetical protein